MSGGGGGAAKGSLAVTNIGAIVTGDLAAPIATGDTIVIREGRIEAIGAGLDVGGIATKIDAAGATVLPGLLDNHVHPVVGDFTPRQNQMDWIDSNMHGGVTTMLSAGEPHTPGRPTDPAGVKALTILAAKSFANLRPAGVKVHAGAVMLEEGLTEGDFREMADAGVRLVAEIGISGVKDPAVAARMTRWAQAVGMKVMVHTGGASIPGSGVIGADFVVTVQPDVAGHTNGGPTALPIGDVERILAETSACIEIVHNGNVKAAAEVAVAAATGNTARLHGLSAGVLAPGRDGDLVVVDTPLGSQASDALGALAIGDTLAVAATVIDGVIRHRKSRNTPPPVRPIAFEG